MRMDSSTSSLGPLLAHDGYVFDHLEGTVDPLNPDNQAVGIRYLKVRRGSLTNAKRPARSASSQAPGPSRSPPQPGKGAGI
jgi:hypothetical protein